MDISPQSISKLASVLLYDFFTWKDSSLRRRSALRAFFWVSAWRRCSASSSDSSSCTCEQITKATFGKRLQTIRFQIVQF